MTSTASTPSGISRSDEPLLGQPEYALDPHLKQTLTDMAASNVGYLVVLKFVISEKRLLGYAPRFINALRTAMRVAFWSWITGLLAWFLRHHEVVPKTYKGKLSGLMLAIIFNSTDDAASTMRSSLQAFIGSLTAIAFSFVLYQIPDPHDKFGESSDYVYEPTRPTCDAPSHIYEWTCTQNSSLFSAGEAGLALETVIAFLFFALFVLVVLSLDVVMPFRTFAILGAVNCMMTFANPKESSSNYMELTWTGEMVASLIVQVAGSIIALAAVMLPPKTATQSVKILAARATLVTNELLSFVTDYYSGDSKTLKVNIWNTARARMRADLKEQDSKIDSSWWEFFDWGNRGIVRYLMLSHLDMLKQIDRRLGVLQIAVKNETFDALHKAAMDRMKSDMMQLTVAVGNLLMHCTVSAYDGVFEEDEIKAVDDSRQAVAEAREQLGANWKSERISRGALSREMRTESFFLLELDSIARIIYDFSETLTRKRPSPVNIAIQYFMKIINIEKLRNDLDFRNFILRNWIAMMWAWWWAVLAHRFNNMILVNVVLMMSLLPGNELVMNLQKLQALVLGSLGGVTMYRAFSSCHYFFKIAKLGTLFFYVLGSMFVARYSQEFATVGLLLAVAGGTKLLQECENDRPSFGDLMVVQGEEFKSLKKFAYSIIVVTLVDLALKREPASDKVQLHINNAFTMTFKYIRDFLNLEIEETKDQDALWESTRKVTDDIDKELGVVEDLLGSADSEPRFSKCPFKATLYSAMVTKLRDLQGHTMCLVRRSQFPAPGIINMMSSMKSFQHVKKDLDETLNDAEALAIRVLMYEGFGSMDPKEFKGVLEKGSTDKLDGVDELVEEIRASNKLPFHEPADCPLEENVLSRLCVVAEMLEVITRDVHDILQLAVENM